MKIRQRLLHVDDDPQFARIVAARLARFDYEVVAECEPRQALTRIARGQFRVVLLDIDMPHLGGLELLQQIKAYDGGIQVIMVTSVATMTTILQSLRLGAEACLFKPLTDIEPLVGAIDDAYRKLDRWWLTLEDLSRRRRQAEQQNQAAQIAIAT